MTPLQEAANNYVTMRRRMGFKFEEAAELLAEFVRYMEENGVSGVTTVAALSWAQSSGQHPNWWAKRLSIVRGFASYVACLEPGHEVPPHGLIPTQSHRATPYLYSRNDIARLMLAARALPSRWWALTAETAIGLLAVTGMRVGEVVRLDLADIDWELGLVAVRWTKFGKSRSVPLHPTTVAALHHYEISRRRRELPLGTLAFFVSTTGERLRYDSLHRTFHRLVRQLGLGTTAGKCPRVHDLRHTFAVDTILGWYRAGADVAARLHLLSTYLGHIDPMATYWYLSAAPELLALVAERLEPAETTPS
ncbi:MAG: tyrosine-type recombinase/integrase [Candidatus Dormibacteraceae bacterium]